MNFQRSQQHLYERSDTQKRTFSKWINSIFKKTGKNIVVRDLIVDFQDGTVLIALLESTTGTKLRQENGRMRVHKISNVNRALEVFQGYDTKLVNIRSEDIVDGNIKLILGLVWSIILQFQVKSVIQQQSLTAIDSTMDLEKSLLLWCSTCTQRYKEVDIKNFTTSWRDGLAFNAIIHNYRPNLFDFQKLVGRPANDNLAHAFSKLQSEFSITPLLEPEDVNSEHPDKKSILMYVTTLYEVLAKTKELTVSSTMESDGSDQATRGDSPTPSSVSTMSEWDDYNETLTQVLAWLLQAESQLKQQEAVSSNVDQVKEQFRDHEEFMMILTSHQASVGSVLEFGSQLINENIVVGKEEREIREQMSVLSERWENLRVAAMQRQGELHQELMKLQQRQLQELANWLSKAESTIESTGPIGSNLEIVKHQVEAHKKFQDDLENQQTHVNSLSHMVVVVDESESENATADLEEQLALLGDRWSAVCKWTGHRWETLQEVLKSWEQYRNEEQRLNEWLYRKEKGLKEISLFDMGDKKEVHKQIQKLKELEFELTQQQNSFGDFNNAAQCVAQTLEEESPAIQNIQETMEDFNRRWNTIASMLNAKMKHFRGIENNLTVLLKEIEENLEWITDTEMLLKPASDKELVESLEQAVKKRKTSIIELSKQGHVLMTQSKSAGQSVVGLEQQLNNFQERWELLEQVIDDKRSLVEDENKKKVFLEEVQKILLIITEINVYIEKIVVEMRNNPKELLIVLETKQNEIKQHHNDITKLSAKSKEINDPATRAAFQGEVDAVSVKLRSAEEKQKEVVDTIRKEAPPDFMVKMKEVQDIINEIFPEVSKEFRYDEVANMEKLEIELKGMVTKLDDLDGPLEVLNKQANDFNSILSLENAKSCQKQVAEVEQQRNDCKKITEARLVRVNEAVHQTQELETATKETINWMDDVDKFLKEITGTIAEGDADTIASQVQEVEALQQDISTVERKVDSLIETCTLITNRAEEKYAENLRHNLDALKTRWTNVVNSTESQKENLKNAGEMFLAIDAGVKEVLGMLNGLDNILENEDFTKLDRIMMDRKIQVYQDYKSQLQSKEKILDDHLSTIKELVAIAKVTNEIPPLCNDIEAAKKLLVSISEKTEANLKKLNDFGIQFEELDPVLETVRNSAEELKESIASVSAKIIDGDEETLQQCLKTLDELSNQLHTSASKKFEELSSDLLSKNVCTQLVQDLIDEYKSRMDEVKERCEKVQLILQGELQKQKQLRDDIVHIQEWMNSTEKHINEGLKNQVEITDEYLKELEEGISLNEELIISIKHNTQNGNFKNLTSDLDTIQEKFNSIKENFKLLQAQPKHKELERDFSALEGEVLSDIDNLKRKIKKLKLSSPEVNDIHSAVEQLEDYTKQCEEINVNLEKIQNIAQKLGSRDANGLDKQVKEVKEEHEKVKQLLKDREKMFAEALPLSESVYAHLDTLNDWLSSTAEQLEQISVNPLPSTPEESVEKVQAIIDDIKKKASDVQQLVNNASSLGQMSEDNAFRAMEQRVRDVHEVYQSVLSDSKDKLDLLKKWIQQLDEYEKKVDDLNTWIDGRMGTLDSIGGVSAKWELELEVQKLKSLKSMVSAKDGDLDSLKAIGDDLVQKGRSSVVEPYEKQIYQRWDELEKKLNNTENMLALKLKEFEEKEKEAVTAEMKRTTLEEEIIITPSNIAVEVYSAPNDSMFDELDAAISKTEEIVNAAVTESLESSPVKQPPPPVSSKPAKRYKREEKVTPETTEPDVQEMIVEIESIETILKELKANNEDEFKLTEENAQKLEDQLSLMQPDFEKLMASANELIQQLGNIEKREPILNLSRRLSGAHADLAIRKRSLKDADHKFNKMRNDLANIKVWLDETEKVLREGKDQNKMKFVEDNIEKYAAEIEGVNLRAEQLSEVCSETLIPKRQITLINKKFKLISYQFEQIQRPEEKETTYKISIETSDTEDADTRANVSVKLFGEYGNSDQLQLRQSETKRKKFQRGQVDLFTFRNQPWLGKLSKLRVWHDNEGVNPPWHLASIYILDELSGRLFCFVFDSWLSKEAGAVLREIPVGAMALYKETGSDILVRNHKFIEVHWLFDTLKLSSNDNRVKSVEELVDDIKKVVLSIEEITVVFDDHSFSGQPYDNLEKQVELMKDIEKSMDLVNPSVISLMMVRQHYLNHTSPEEMHQIDVQLTIMCARWNALHKVFREHYIPVEKNVGNLQQFNDEISSLALFLTKVENQLNENKKDDLEKELYDEINRNEFKLNDLNNIGEVIISEINDANVLREKLDTVNTRWNDMNNSLNSRKLGFLMDDSDIKDFVQRTDEIKESLNGASKLVFNTKPHPVDKQALHNYLEELKKCQRELLELKEEAIRLSKDAGKLLERSDLSPGQLEEINFRCKSCENQVEDLTTGLEKRLYATEENLTRATRFLDELNELSGWMEKTRDLLEGHKAKKPGYNVDPEIMKKSLETRKNNVLSINDLLKDIKTEGELTSGNFPQAVGDKIARLNVDWQIIIRLALALKERPVSEEMVVAESMQEKEEAPMMFEEMCMSSTITTTSYVTEEYKTEASTSFGMTRDFDKNVAQLHDWLKLVEQKIKSLNISIGDEDDMTTIQQKQAAIQTEMQNRKTDYEDTIEMAADLNMSSGNEAANYAVDDKVSKLKEHWEVVWQKVLTKKSLINQVLIDWRRYNEVRLQLDNYIYKADMQLNENQHIGTTVTELEEQLEKHKVFQDELVVWSGTYNTLRQLAETILQTYSQEELNEFKSTVNETNTRWNSLEERSNTHQDSLQEALDRLLQFHKNMISALTWLSSAESKVAELDSLLESNQAEDSSDFEELQREMQELEEDISSHQVMFHGLNETGKQIMVDLEAGEVKTALQSKLDDMNDRWNSLGVRVVDIRDRMSYGTGEWRQLLLDMQEIVDWLSRAGQELMSQQPIASDIEMVHQQNKNHQDFKSKLTVRRVVIEQALEQGHNFLLKHQAQANDPAYIARGDKLVIRVASSLREQLTHIESQWQELQHNSDKWEKTISLVLELMNKLLEDIEDINKLLNESEEIVNHWVPIADLVVDDMPSCLEETKEMFDRMSTLESDLDSMNGTVKELRHIHGVQLAKATEGVIEQLHERWRQLLNDCQTRQDNLQNINGGNDKIGELLNGSVPSPWERGQALNKVPYFINHTIKTTQWDHPKMTELYQTLSELNDVKFAAYRTSMKLRCLQKACCLDLCELNGNVKKAFEQHGLRSNNENLIDVGEILTVLVTIFENIDKNKKDSINVPQCVDMTLNWLLNVYDSGRIGKIRVLSFKTGIILLSRAKLEDKWKCLFRQIADSKGQADNKKLGLLLYDCVQIPRQLGEIASFGGSNIEPSVRSCFEMAKNNNSIDANNFVAWTNAEPQSLVWMPVMHRLAAAETAKHDAKCGICKDYPIVGFRYRCLKCFNFDLCQQCFWSGRVSKSHRVTHPMHQYSLATTTGEDLSDFVKLMRNKFKSRRYRSRPPKKLGYLPVQTIMEGSSIETPSEPMTPDLSMAYHSMNGNTQYDDHDNEEHHLIKVMCQSLNGEVTGYNSTPKSPSQILAQLDEQQKQNIDEIMRGLEEEHQALQEEYNRLKGAHPNQTLNNGHGGNVETAQDAELMAEAKILMQHKGRLEARMQILEDHNRQLESQLQRLRQLLEQPPSERDRSNNPPSPKGLTPALTPSSSYHGSPELGRRDVNMNGFSQESAMDIHHVTSQIEHAFPTSNYNEE